MKTQTRILDNRLYYTRKIELHRKSKKSSTVWITPTLICGICSMPQLKGKCGRRPFLGGSERRAGAHTGPAFAKMPTAQSSFPGGKAPWSRRKSPGTETHSARSVPQITRPVEVLHGNWRGSDRNWSAVFAARPTLRAIVAQGLFYGGSGRRAVAHTRPVFAKMPTAPSAFSWWGAPQAPGD